MLKSQQTHGYLVTNLNDRVVSNDEAYAATATSQDIGPVARSVFIIEKADEKCGDNVVRYGQDIRIRVNPFLINKPLYLHSQQLTPLVFARFSRNQEVCLHTKKIHNTVWRIQPSSGVREDRCGEPVNSKDQLIFEHVATNQYLSNDNI